MLLRLDFTYWSWVIANGNRSSALITTSPLHISTYPYIQLPGLRLVLRLKGRMWRVQFGAWLIYIHVRICRDYCNRLLFAVSSWLRWKMSWQMSREVCFSSLLIRHLLNLNFSPGIINAFHVFHFKAHPLLKMFRTQRTKHSLSYLIMHHFFRSKRNGMFSKIFRLAKRLSRF